MRAAAVLGMVVLAVLAVGLSGARVAAEDGPAFKVIVNPENPASSVDRDLLRGMYLKKSPEWTDGVTVHPLDLSARFAVRHTFVERVIRKTASQLRTYWNQQIFSGKSVPPPETDSVADAIAYVLAHRGAVAYIPADADPGKAKVIGIR